MGGREFGRWFWREFCHRDFGEGRNMNEQEFLARCSNAVRDSSATFLSIESLNGFFQLLRPTGEKVDQVLFGSEIAVDIRGSSPIPSLTLQSPRGMG